jgi:pimeloyl-ACP methyl ester carboxylesterase
MPFVTVDGISTRYDVIGDGPALLMYSPGGFNATIETWSTLGVYARVKPLDYLSKRFKCIVFDRRETGQSGGRIERVTWRDMVAQGMGLLDHLGIDRAFLMGGCMGVSPVIAFATQHPQRVLGQVLYWPVGGARYRMSSHQRFSEHLAFVSQNGMAAVVELALESGKPFGADPRGGPWASVIQTNKEFAKAFASFDVTNYRAIVTGMGRTLFDRDTAPGAEPEDLLLLNTPTLIIPGQDASHATSAAMYLHECIPNSEYWAVNAADQQAGNTTERLDAFFQSAFEKQGLVHA